MKYSQQELKKYYQQPIVVEEVLNLEQELKQRDSEILAVSKMKVSGIITPSQKDTLVHLQVKGILTLPSTRSLEPVDYPVDITIDEVYLFPNQVETSSHDENDIILLEDNILDLKNTIEDYLLLAIPSQVLTEEELSGKDLPKGSFWEVVSEEDYEKQQAAKEAKVDPRLAKLGELFKEDSDKK